MSNADGVTNLVIPNPGDIFMVHGILVTGHWPVNRDAVTLVIGKQRQSGIDLWSLILKFAIVYC